MSSAASTKGPTTTAISVIEAMPPATILTTTVFTSASATPAASSSSSQKSGDDVPIAAIAGGAAAGVVLALAAVLIWHYWGRSIKRKEAEKRKQAFAFFQVRENTRRNASSFGGNYTSYRPHATRNGERKVTVKFIGGHSRSMSNDSGISISEKEKSVLAETPAPSTPPMATRSLTNAPARPSPLAKSLTPPEQTSSPVSSPTEVSAPLLPPRRAATRSNTETSQLSALARPTSTHNLAVPQLNHKSSNASSVSVYSTQSGEERVMRVPPSLIMAAFSRPDPAHPVIPEYTPATRLSAAEYDEQNRLSRASQGSVGSQPDGGIGYAR